MARATSLVALIATGLYATPTATAQEGLAGTTVTPAMATTVIDSTLSLLTRRYVDSAVASAMAIAVRERIRRGEYRAATTGRELAEKLTADLRAVSKDLHLVVNFDASRNGDPLAATEGPASERTVSVEDARARFANFGFSRVERLRGNIGYLVLSEFFNPQQAGPTAVAALKFLEHTEALIVDLRENDGGSPNMVALLTSWFIDRSVELTGIYTRADGRLHQSWVLPFVGVPKYVGKPVYVLTSREGTVSAAEGFTYNLKVLGRATIVGETSAGAANPGSEVPVGWGYSVFIPTGRPVNPTTGTNWEGVGIAPDVAVSAARAFDVAYDAALGALLNAASDARTRERLEGIIEERRERRP